MNYFLKDPKDFNCKLIVVPHPKYKSANKNIKSFNPYFNKFIVDNRPDAINKLSNNVIFLNKGSTHQHMQQFLINQLFFFTRPITLMKMMNLSR